MKRTAFTLPLALALTLAAPLAQAQMDGVSTVVCESHRGQFNECRTPFGGHPVLVQALSSAACVQGHSWGSRWPGTVWVAQGCRARFADASGNAAGGLVRHEQPYERSLGDLPPAPVGTPVTGAGSAYVLRCESEDHRSRTCRAPVQGRLVLHRQLSQAACIEGQTWGSGNGSVWVRGGCRGEFAPAGGYAAEPGALGGWGYGGYTVTCSSENGRYTQCGWDRRQGRPHLIEQISQSDCREGHSWGYSRNQLWVNHGCRGRFAAR